MKVFIVYTHPSQDLEKFGHLGSMRTVMLGVRLFDRAERKEMVIFDSMTKSNMELRDTNWNLHLKRAYELGKNL